MTDEAIFLVYGCSFLMALFLMCRRRHHLAVFIICFGFLVATLAVVMDQPNLVPAPHPKFATNGRCGAPQAAERSPFFLFLCRL